MEGSASYPAAEFSDDSVLNAPDREAAAATLPADAPASGDLPTAGKEQSNHEAGRRPLTDEEVLFFLDEFLYHGELRDFVKAQHSFERISYSLGTDDFDALVPPCLEVLEFSNQYIRNDTLLCLLYISLGCTVCDVPSQDLVSAMRKHAAILARHDSLPMFIRSLDFLLGHEPDRLPIEDGMLEREFRLIFNCIYIQLLFNEHDPGFVRSLELGQGKLGASLVSLLFEATKLCADNEKLPIKKVTLLLLRILKCLLAVDEAVLYPMPDPYPADSATQEHMDPPRLREFQAFSAMQLHKRGIIQKYNGHGRPAAVEEGLRLIQRYEDEFLSSYEFHPSEVAFMQNSAFLQEAHARLTKSRPQQRHLQHHDDIQAPIGEPNASESHGAAGILQSLAPADSWWVKPEIDSCREGPAGRASALVPEAGDSSDACSSADASEAGTEASDATVVASKEFVEQAESVSGNAARASIQKVDQNAPQAVFQRLYFAIFPRLTETVVLLLRLLLTSCSNVDNYPGVVDMARERHATAFVGDVSEQERSLLADVECGMPSEGTEKHRHREIMAAAVSGILLMLLKQATGSASEQFSALAQLITDSNGALVVLKFLNQDISAATEPQDTPPVLPCLCTQPALAGSWVASWTVCATLRLVDALYLLCKDSPERVRKYLIHYKAPFILKRLHRIENQQVQSLVLKLLKKQIRYMPRKWKQANMKSISAIFSTVPMSPLEDWLLNEPLSEVATEGPSQADIRASNVAYSNDLLRHLSSGSDRHGRDDLPTVDRADGWGDSYAPAGHRGAGTQWSPEPASWCGGETDYARLFPEFVPAGV